MAGRLTAADFPVSEEQRAEILGDLLSMMDRKSHSSSNPQLVFVTGQPAAGKSRTIERIVAGMDTPAVILDSDALRLNHPQMAEIMRRDPQRMDVLSDGPVGQWMGASIEHARQRGYNTIIENTLTNPAEVAATATDFRDAGYSVGVAALAVPEQISRLGIISRYVSGLDSDEYPRWTTEASHSGAYVDMLSGLETVTGVADTIEVYTRNGDPLYAGRDGVMAAQAVISERQRGLSPQQVTDWAEDYHRVAGRLLEPGVITPQTATVIGNVVGDAEQIIAPEQLPEDHHRVREVLESSGAATPAPLAETTVGQDPGAVGEIEVTFAEYDPPASRSSLTESPASGAASPGQIDRSTPGQQFEQ